jgi:hypothetical protein
MLFKKYKIGDSKLYRKDFMTKEEMRALTQKQLEAYNKRDLEAFCQCFHPEVVTNNLVTGLGSSPGIDGFKERYRKLFESNPNLHCEIKTRIVHEFTVIDEEFVTGASTYPNGLHASAVYAFRDGLIDRVWFMS